MIGIVSGIILYYFNINPILGFLIIVAVLVVCNGITGYIISKLQLKAFNSDCDPELYLEMLNKQEKRVHKNIRYINYLAINRAAGYLSLGEFQMAKECLEGIDTSYLSEKDGTYLVYTINLIGCYYEIGEIEKAENLYETNLVRLSPFGKKLKKSVEILIGERYFYLEKYSLSYEHLNKLRNYDLNKRQYLGVLYLLAQMDVMNGVMDQAVVKFKKIAKLGNKLWIAKASQEMLDTMKSI
jgi:tetratricopeptide (TPR) repeat protein